MGIDSLGFLIFLGCLFFIYYLVSERIRPYVLIAFSFLFVVSYSWLGIAFLAGESLLIWQAGRMLSEAGQSQKSSTEITKRKRRILIFTLTVTIGILALLKYLGPAAIHRFLPGSAFRLFVPIGLSYYTLQAVSYVMDVYWGRIPAEKKYDRVLLFLCYFPQILQGPISRYRDLSQQFYEKDHSFQAHNLKYGIQLSVFGYFKLFVVGEKAHAWTVYCFHSNQTAYGWTALFGLVMFGIELYSNFSGGIDIIRGISQSLNINLCENFTQPFFSRSLGEFWRRWHISLGTWMKDYVFFPLSMSRPFSRMKKQLKKRIDKKSATRLTLAIADVLVFLIVGIWHGLGTNYALWGLYNGLILGFSELMLPIYAKTRTRLGIREDSTGFRLFAVLRTFLLVTLGWCTDCADTALGSLEILRNIFCFSATNFGILHTSFFGYAKAALPICILLTVDLLHEQGVSIRDRLNRTPFPVQVLFWAIVIQFIACFGRTASLGGLMYAGF